MLSQKHRLSQKKDFQKIYQQKQTYHSPFFIAKFINNKLDYSRLAVVVSTKTMSKATDRNKSKRRIKSICQKNWSQLKKNIDLIIIGKKKLTTPTHKQLEQELMNFFQKQKLL